MVEVELLRKEKIIDELVAQQEANIGVSKLLGQARTPGGLKGETHLVMNLKRKIRDLNMESAKKSEEIEALRRNIKATRL